MTRLRILIISLIAWLIVLFNMARPDIFIGDLDLTLRLSPVLYVIAAGAVLVILLLPDLGQIRLWALFIPLAVIYTIIRFIITPFDPYSPKVTTYFLITEILALFATVVSARLVSLAVSNVEQAVENVFSDPSEDRVLHQSEGTERINVELYRARKFNRRVGFIYINVASLSGTEVDEKQLPRLETAFQQRYLQNKVAQVASAALYRSDIICWHNNNLLICLPETSQADVANVARRLANTIRVYLSKFIPMGTATFPDNGLILDDLIAAVTRQQFFFHGEQEDLDEEEIQDIPSPEESKEVVLRRKRDTREIPAVVGDLNKPGGQSVDLFEESNITSNGAGRKVAVFYPDEASIPAPDGTLALNMPRKQSILERMVEVLPKPRRPNGLFDPSDARPDNPDFWVNRLPYQSVTSRRVYQFVKRILDVSMVLASAPVTLPIFGLVALAVYLDSGRPIFFRQERTGLGGHGFKMLKFRTMVPNAEELLRDLAAKGLAQLDERGKLAAPLKLDHDPRITRLGRILRKTSLDEIPQLINVLRGDMSIIGPRPTSWGVRTYTLPQTERLNVRPGITGLWQVYGRGTTDFKGWVKWDVLYIDKMSISLDIRLFLLTAKQVLKRKGAR